MEAKFLPQEVLDNGERLEEGITEKWFSGRLNTLNKFAVVGFSEKQQYDQMIAFLDIEGMVYDTDGNYLIWLDVLNAGIAKILKQKLKQ